MSAQDPATQHRHLRKEDFTVRPYESGDEQQIIELFALCFHHRRELDHWTWQYRDNPEGGPRITVACDPEGRIVAHYAGYPVRFYHASGSRGRSFLAHQIGDTMTHPAVRHIGRGPHSLLSRCALRFYQEFCEGQVAFNYGVNVGNIQKFSLRFLRAHRIEPIPYRTLTLGRPLATRAAGITTEPVAQVDERWDRLYHEVRDAYRYLTTRDACHLDWRYLRRPGFTYLLTAAWRRRQLVGWSVFRRQGERLVWGDGLFHPQHPQVAGALLAQALATPAAEGVTQVGAWFPERPPWLASELQGLGFESRPEPQDLALMSVPFEDPAAPEDLGRELYYAMGDSDLF